MFIDYLFIIPILGALNVILINRENAKLCKRVGLLWSMLVMVYFIILLNGFYLNSSLHMYTESTWLAQYLVKVNWGPLIFSVDGISLYFIGLTILLVPTCILISWTSIKFMIKEFIVGLFS